LAARRELIWYLTVDALKKQFSGSVLGLWWVFIKPLFLVGLYAFVFTVVFHPAQDNGQGHAYWIVLLTGLTPWLLLAEPLTAASGAIAANAPLLNKVVFPTEVFPICRVLSSAMSGLAVLVVLTAILAWTGTLGLWALLMPAAVLIQLMYVMGMAWTLAAVCVTVPDFRQALPFLLNIWMFASPVVYLPSMVPQGWSWIREVNPMWTVIGIYRSLLLDNQPPAPAQVGLLALWAVVTFVVGYLVFLKRRSVFADLL
jgi:ABC-type polysaccharide/polyol phosphate export permease